MTAGDRRGDGEWLLGGALLAVCAALTVLQYRWTGGLARAEMERLRGDLAGRAQSLAHEFDAELAASCDELTPGRAEFADRPRDEAHLSRFDQWRATKPRPIFSRMALGISVSNRLELLMLDPSARQFVGAPWPAEWTRLMESLTAKARGGPPPAPDKEGLLLEFPVFTGQARRGEHWLILEISRAYLRDRWLPELVATHLNPGGIAVNDARVETAGQPHTVFFGPAGGDSAPPHGLVSVSMNLLGRTGLRPGPRGPSGAAWVLETWQRPGVLEATVARSRRRNLAVAAALSLLMLATGLALVRHAGESRRLAGLQMNFVAAVSHELRTPLTVIRGAAHNLKRGVVRSPAQIEQYANLILQHADQLTEMTEQVLTLAGAQKGGLKAGRQPISVAEVLQAAIVATAEEVHAAGCHVELRLPPALPRANGDAAALRRAFQNLISNAAKHGGQGGWIGVTATVRADGGSPVIEVRVADKGPGIPAEESKRLFKPFFRGAAAQANQVRGSGLGLSLVKEIIEAHGGAVAAGNDRVDGTGATFFVTLPAAVMEVP